MWRTFGIQPTNDDDEGASVEVFPAIAAAAAAAAAVVITSDGNDVGEPSHRQNAVPDPEGPGSCGNYVSGLARSSSDVTSQRRFHRRRSAVRCPTGLAPVSGFCDTRDYQFCDRVRRV